MADPTYLRFFPYEEPYPNQVEAMDRISAAIAERRNVLFEGAPGTGKTLAALVPALEYAKREDKTVVITTNVHQQMRQFITEARAIARSASLRAVVFRGKASMCHIDVGYEECQILRDNTHDLVELEDDRRQLARRQRELLERSQAGDADAAEARAAVMQELESVEEELSELADQRTCDHYYHNLAVDENAFEQWLFEDVRTPDEIYAFAGEKGLCGYELLKDAMGEVDLVVCNYHHLLDAGIRRQFFRWLDRDPADVITVFDEAHNIERAAREHASRTVSERTLGRAIDELDEVEDAGTAEVGPLLEAFHRALVSVYEGALEAEGTGEIGTEWKDIAIDNPDRPDDLTASFRSMFTSGDVERTLEAAIALGRTIDERHREAYRTGETNVRRESATLRAAAFIDAYLNEAALPGQYPVVSVRRDERSDEVYGHAELYTCIPRDVTRALFDDVHASVLMSATLRPFDVTAEVLGLPDADTLAYGLEFPPENRRTFAVDVPPLFASERDNPRVQTTLTAVLEDAISCTPGNVLLFFPSYSEAERYAGRVTVDTTVYLDEPGVRAESLRESFVADDDAALFTSLWGTLTEGVSFDGDAAHAVVVVGVPYPHLDDRMQAVQEAYDDVFRGPDVGWEYAIEIPTIRKTRQALGRVIRAPEEVGVRVLVDRRYTDADMGRYGVRDTFPPDERAELVDVEPGKLKYAMVNFYAGHGAWQGNPPTP